MGNMVSNIAGIRIIGQDLEIVHDIERFCVREYLESGLPITNNAMPCCWCHKVTSVYI